MTDEAVYLRSLAGRVVEAAQARVPVRAALLAGSAGRGDADEFSDIGLLFYVDDVPSTEAIAEIREAVGGVDPLRRFEATEYVNGEEFRLELFRGDPLAEIDALWAESEQRRLIAARADLLERAGRLRLEHGDASGALDFAEAAAATDTSNERPVQLAMEAEASLGRRDAVEDRYELLRRDLDVRFGLEPSRETKALYRHLLSQDPDPSLTATPAPSP